MLVTHPFLWFNNIPWSRYTTFCYSFISCWTCNHFYLLPILNTPVNTGGPVFAPSLLGLQLGMALLGQAATSCSPSEGLPSCFPKRLHYLILWPTIQVSNLSTPSPIPINQPCFPQKDTNSWNWLKKRRQYKQNYSDETKCGTKTLPAKRAPAHAASVLNSTRRLQKISNSS